MQLQNRIQHQFRQPRLLLQALTHRSYASQNYERFEFVGDGILNYTVALMLFEAFPHLNEGNLSRLRASLINQSTLVQIAEQLQLSEVLLLGKGELKSGGAYRPSILADALEAIFAAVSFDAGLDAAMSLIRRLFAPRIALIDPQQSNKDPKSRLQEALQARRFAVPKYRIENKIGKEHEGITLEVSCDLGELDYICYASAASRREAEQQCAQQALEWLKQHHPHRSDKTSS